MYRAGGVGGVHNIFWDLPQWRCFNLSVLWLWPEGEYLISASNLCLCLCVFVYHKKAPICVFLCVTVGPVPAPSSCVSTANSFFSSGRFVSHTRIPFAYGTWILYFLLWARPLCITVNLTTSNIGGFKYQNIQILADVCKVCTLLHLLFLCWSETKQ